MKIITCDRHECKLTSGKSATIDALIMDYRCVECGGRLIATPVIVDYIVVGHQIVCGLCAGEEFEHAREIRKQQVEAVEVLAGLPQELQKAVMRQRLGALSDMEQKELSKCLFGD